MFVGVFGEGGGNIITQRIKRKECRTLIILENTIKYVQTLEKEIKKPRESHKACDDSDVYSLQSIQK